MLRSCAGLLLMPLSGCAILPKPVPSLPRPAAAPFLLGVASGDPSADGFVIWTRLCRDPLAPDGGVQETVVVAYEIATDESFGQIVQRGEVAAAPAAGHAVHIEALGLQPDRWHWYRFFALGQESPVGRARTLPAAEQQTERLAFAVASCQHFEHGFYAAYEAMAEDEVDLVLFLGDYIYETAGGKGGVRSHEGGECLTLADYRRRYAQYRSDPMLQRMHARCPWIVTWDDHEVDNNYAGLAPEKEKEAGPAFAARRAAAYQAFFENMPLRAACRPQDGAMRLYRSFSYGSLCEFVVLDTRQHRTDQPNGDGRSPLNDEALRPTNTILGQEQRQCAQAQLAASQAQWNCIAQQVMVAMVSQQEHARNGLLYHMDKWTGYVHERVDFVRFLQEHVRNPVILTGDIHSNWAIEVRVDDRDPSLAPVAPEFVVTSISSGGDGEDQPAGHLAVLERNPGVKLLNKQRGYLRCIVTKDRWRTEFVVLDKVTSPGGTASVRAAYSLRSGDPRLREERP